MVNYMILGMLIVSGLSKPIGVLAFNDHLYISDQVLGQILKAPIAHPDQYKVFATNVLRVESNGQTSVFQSGFQEVRGIADLIFIS